ncbi:uncharacterized protein LOC110980453 [Acanthaster planci]|uniref:Uncharacterized protein LOC110980453 n=1 Tax=Acanthaster planci TaxID=133434 RepID=A0A8B7YK80_ACAPL|nr:uncharacterized protein LOC110980453 [Acanthaster planci]
MYLCTLGMLIMLLGAAVMIGVATAQEGVEDRLGDFANVSATLTVSCEEYEKRIGCNVERLCSCDELCETLNDCCQASYRDHVTKHGVVGSTSATGESNQSLIARDTPRTGAYHVCVELPSTLTGFKKNGLLFHNEYMLPQGYWMVGRCPPSWKDLDIRHLCEAPDDESDLMLLLPVVASNDPSTSFRNIYCAVCHGVPVSQMRTWRIQSNVSLASLKGANDSEEILQAVDSLKVFNTRNIQFKHDFEKLRSCVAHEIDNCPLDFGDDGIKRACRSHTMAVVHPVTHVRYRNWYCALCNNALHVTMCHLFKLGPHKVWSPTLTALVDFQGNRVSIRDIAGADSRPTHVENTCGRNEFLDPFTLRCRALMSSGGWEREIPSEPTIIQSECVQPGHVDVEIDMYFGQNSTSTPCELWGECLGVHDSSVWSTEWCKSQELHEERSGLFPVRVHLTVNSTIQALDKILNENPQVTQKRQCPSTASVMKVVLRKGCISPTGSRCMDYDTTNESSVYLAAWNNSESLYLRDFNGLLSLQDSLYQVTYTWSNGNTPDRAHSVSACGDFVHFNCSLIQINSSTFSQLLTDNQKPLADDGNHISLESGGDLVCYYLLSPPYFPQPGVFGGHAIFIVTVIGFLISMVALVASFVTYLVFPSLRNLPGRCVMSLIAAVFSAQLLLLITGDDVARSVSKASCTLLAVLLHYTCLSTFSWTNALAFYLARTLGPGAKPAAASQLRNSFMYFSFFGWGAPFIIVLTCIILHFVSLYGTYGVSEEYGGIRSCSFTDRIMEIAAFVAPVGISLLTNFGFFLAILVGFTFRRAPSTNLCSKEARTSRMRRDAFISIKIGFLLAFTWIFGFLASAFKSDVIVYIFCIMTSLQGVYIFLAFTFTKQVKALWREKLGLVTARSTTQKKTQRKYFKKPKTVVSSTAEKKAVCRKHSPSEQQTADTAHTCTAKNTDMV